MNIDIGRVRIRRADKADSYVAPADVAVLVLHHHTILLSVGTLRELALAGASIMATDAQHMPCALMLPTQANRAAASRLRRQIKHLDDALSQALWQEIVRSRIRTQAANLRHFELTGALRLERMVDEVETADRTHREGQAARHYWQHLWQDAEPGFRREKQGAEDSVNARLNFGYAVLRSLVARELVAAGLSPELGVGHHSTENPFNLADDFMEPYRFVVERVARPSAADGEFDAVARVAMSRIVEQAVRIGKKDYRLLPGVRETIASYVRVLESSKGELALPHE
ncbi:MAG: type II CRISPR-associated endonuclease Cas1 [Polaromonas sp.]|nr:type II CRISPR-associated endonuclease Cas1 [Polaromonas sp.]